MNSKPPLPPDFKPKQAITRILLAVFIICAVICLVVAVMMFAGGGPGLDN